MCFVVGVLSMAPGSVTSHRQLLHCYYAVLCCAAGMQGMYEQ
jgi:hypothetical protein